jgi:hypothetical protein
MKLLQTQDGFIPLDRVTQIIDRGDGTMLVQWFNGYQVPETIAKVRRKKLADRRVVLSAPGVELQLEPLSKDEDEE